MVTKKKNAKTSRVKVGKLKLNRETVKDLSTKETKKVKGGVAIVLKPTNPPCGTNPSNCLCETNRCTAPVLK